MTSSAEIVIDVFILTGVTSYTVTALCYIATMWNTRKVFYIALRSPLLACLCGVVFTLFSSFTTYVYILGWYKKPAAGMIVDEQFFPLIWVQALLLIAAPANFIAGCALIAWALRLVVLYDPIKRKRWGHRTKDASVVRALAWAFAALQGVVFLAVPLYGLQRVSFYTMTILDMIGNGITLLAVLLLGGPLKRVHDIFSLSRDVLRLGALMVCAVVANGILWSAEMGQREFKYFIAAIAIFAWQPIVFTIVIKPVRDFLRQNTEGGTLFSWLPTRRLGKNRSSIVAGASESQNAQTKFVSSTRMSPLVDVMEFLPLREAFGEFCHHALCSESFQFLVDVSEYQNSVSTADGKDDYELFVAIVKEYIKNNSDSEINIDDRTKKNILRFGERSAYTSLSTGDRVGVFELAEKEIGRMLAENLLDKFKATDEYKHVTEIAFQAD